MSTGTGLLPLQGRLFGLLVAVAGCSLVGSFQPTQCERDEDCEPTEGSSAVAACIDGLCRVRTDPFYCVSEAGGEVRSDPFLAGTVVQGLTSQPVEGASVQTCVTQACSSPIGTAETGPAGRYEIAQDSRIQLLAVTTSDSAFLPTYFLTNGGWGEAAPQLGAVSVPLLTQDDLGVLRRVAGESASELGSAIIVEVVDCFGQPAQDISIRFIEPSGDPYPSHYLRGLFPASDAMGTLESGRAILLLPELAGVIGISIRRPGSVFAAFVRADPTIDAVFMYRFFPVRDEN